MCFQLHLKVFSKSPVSQLRPFPSQRQGSVVRAAPGAPGSGGCGARRCLDGRTTCWLAVLSVLFEETEGCPSEESLNNLLLNRFSRNLKKKKKKLWLLVSFAELQQQAHSTERCRSGRAGEGAGPRS